MVQFAIPKHTDEFANNSVLMMCSEESKHHRRASWGFTLARLMEKFGEKYTMSKRRPSWATGSSVFHRAADLPFARQWGNISDYSEYIYVYTTSVYLSIHIDDVW